MNCGSAGSHLIALVYLHATNHHFFIVWSRSLKLFKSDMINSQLVLNLLFQVIHRGIQRGSWDSLSTHGNALARWNGWLSKANPSRVIVQKHHALHTAGLNQQAEWWRIKIAFVWEYLSKMLFTCHRLGSLANIPFLSLVRSTCFYYIT